MSYLGLLINTCSISRPSVTYTKGRPSPKVYALVSAGVSCRIQWHKGGTDTQHPREQGYETMEGYFGFFVYGQDIQQDDRIVDERTRAFIVKSVPPDVTGMSHHIEVGLEIEK